MDDVNRTRERVGGTFVVDYQHETGDIGFLNSLSKSTTNALNNSEILAWRVELILRFQADETNNELTTLTNILTLRAGHPFVSRDVQGITCLFGEQQSHRPPVHVLAAIGRRFCQSGKLLRMLIPGPLPVMATPNPGQPVFARLRSSDVLPEERTLNGSLDLETQRGRLGDGDRIVKFGGSVSASYP